jgi:glutamate N-acetyltransferase/amino-acid N-acetyltransferase
MFSIFPIKGGISCIDGFYCDGYSANLKPNNQKDLGFIYSDTLCDVEAIFTSNRFKAAPLRHYLRYEKDFLTNFVLINSKNANAMTGQSGIDDIDDIFTQLKEKFTNITNPIMSSTGVIGVPLPKEKIIQTAKTFDLQAKDSSNLAKAIMTTDSYPKSIAYEVKLDNNQSFKIAAVAKGAGMINPNLATMLCFICTDANIPKEDMKELLTLNATTTFNAISVDGDTSTNDTVLLMTNHKSNIYDKEAFKEALHLVMQDMALMIIKDAEGGKKVAKFKIINAFDDNEAQKVAKALSDSLLVKTALFGEDPNWGRIASTIGASQVQCDETKLIIKFDDIVVYDKGKILFTKEIEQQAAKVLQKDSFTICCDLQIKDGSFTAYGCDLGYEYVKINADYRT